MGTGDLKDRVTIESRTTAINEATGEQNQTWSTDSTMWAKKETAGGSEGEKSDIITNQQRINFIIRYRSNLEMNTADYRVIYNSNIFDIEVAEEVTTEASRTWMRLKCVYRSNI